MISVMEPEPGARDGSKEPSLLKPVNFIRGAGVGASS